MKLSKDICNNKFLKVKVLLIEEFVVLPPEDKKCKKKKKESKHKITIKTETIKQNKASRLCQYPRYPYTYTYICMDQRRRPQLISLIAILLGASRVHWF